MCTIFLFFDCVTLEVETDRLSINVGNYESILLNIPAERRCHLHRGGSVKSRIFNVNLSLVLKKKILCIFFETARCREEENLHVCSGSNLT